MFQNFLLLSKRKQAIIPVGYLKVYLPMNWKAGRCCKETLALMVLKTLDLLGPQHGYGIALAHRADLSRRPSGCESGHADPPPPLKLEHEEA